MHDGYQARIKHALNKWINEVVIGVIYVHQYRKKAWPNYLIYWISGRHKFHNCLNIASMARNSSNKFDPIPHNSQKIIRSLQEFPCHKYTKQMHSNRQNWKASSRTTAIEVTYWRISKVEWWQSLVRPGENHQKKLIIRTLA